MAVRKDLMRVHSTTADKDVPLCLWHTAFKIITENMTHNTMSAHNTDKEDMDKYPGNLYDFGKHNILPI